MDQNALIAVTGDVEDLSTKSWTAYFGTAVLSVILLAIAIALWQAWKWVGASAFAVFTLYIVYRVLVLRSYRLYSDDAGVWVFSGVLPWRKGVIGVKWRDMDEALYVQTFWSWLYRSYDIRIAHRFTKSSEIFLTAMARGHEAVMRINEKHQAYIRANALA